MFDAVHRVVDASKIDGRTGYIGKLKKAFMTEHSHEYRDVKQDRSADSTFFTSQAHSLSNAASNEALLRQRRLKEERSKQDASWDDEGDEHFDFSSTIASSSLMNIFNSLLHIMPGN